MEIHARSSDRYVFSAFLLVMFVYKTKDLCEVNLHEFGKEEELKEVFV